MVLAKWTFFFSQKHEPEYEIVEPMKRSDGSLNPSSNNWHTVGHRRFLTAITDP